MKPIEQSLTLSELAKRLNARLTGDREPDSVVAGMSTLQDAGPEEVCYYGNPRYRRFLSSTEALAVIASEGETGLESCSCGLLLVEDAYLAFREALMLFMPDRRSGFGEEGRPSTSVVHPDAVVDESVLLGHFSVVDRDCRIGPGTVIGPGCYLGPGVVVGEDCVLRHNVTLEAGTVLEDRIIVHSGAVLGSDGFGFARGPSGPLKVPQNGNVVVRSDVEIGANCAIDRGTVGNTIIEAHTKLDNLVHLAHNVRLGSACMLAAQTGIAGSTVVGNGVVFGGQAGLVGHLNVGDGSAIGAQAGVTKDIRAGTTVSGYPARLHDKARKIEAVTSMLPELLERIRKLERRFPESSEGLESGTDEPEADNSQ